MGTTFSNYGKLPAYQVKDVIQNLDFSGKNKKISSKKLEKLLAMIKDDED